MKKKYIKKLIKNKQLNVQFWYNKLIKSKINEIYTDCYIYNGKINRVEAKLIFS